MRNAAKKLKVYIKNVWRSKNLIAFVFLMPWLLGFLHVEGAGMGGIG